MQDIRIISVVTCEDEATAQAAADAVADAIRPYGGTVDTAPWTKDLAAKRRAEFVAERARDAAAKAEADRTAGETILADLAASDLDAKVQEQVAAMVTKATGVAVTEEAAVTP